MGLVFRLPEARRELGAGDAQRDFSPSRVAEAAGAQRNVRGIGVSFNHAVVNRTTVGVVEVKGHGATAPVGGRWSVESYQRLPVGLVQSKQLLEKPAGQTAHAFVNRVDPDRFDVLKTDLHRRERQIVER